MAEVEPTLENAIRAALAAAAGVVALVKTQIHPAGSVPAEALAAAGRMLDYTVTGGQTLHELGNTAADYRPATFEVNAYAPTVAACVSLANAVRTALDGYGGTPAGVELDTLYEDQSDPAPVVAEGGTKPISYVRTLNFRALYRPT